MSRSAMNGKDELQVKKTDEKKRKNKGKKKVTDLVSERLTCLQYVYFAGDAEAEAVLQRRFGLRWSHTVSAHGCRRSQFPIPRSAANTDADGVGVSLRSAAVKTGGRFRQTTA
nr:hypothetical protein Iba_chr04eCG7650 [Ipomoea batatas]GME18896.1 hypothetical protein Iba_scaffold21539CG0370 [Ipomoea batatas]